MARPFLLAGLLATLPIYAAAAAAPPPVDLAPFLRKDLFEEIVLSPTGEYLAATVPLEDRTGLVVMRYSDRTVTAQVAMTHDNHVIDIAWVSDDRLVMAMAQTFGSEDQPTATGEIFAMDADGSAKAMLVGYRAATDSVGSHIRGRDEQLVAAYMIDDLPDDDAHVLVTVSPFDADPTTRVERMDVHSGKRSPITRVSARNADFLTDNAHRVRMAVGYGPDNARLLFHRADDNSEWSVINDEAKSGIVEVPIGFSADDRIAYLRAEQKQGPDVVVAFDTVTGERKPLLQDEVVDPHHYLWSLGATPVLVGANFQAGPVGQSRYFDPASPEARVHRMLENAFPGQRVHISSSTRDGALALVWVGGATNPGDYYLFDVKNRKADHVLSSAEWIDPEAMGEVRQVVLKARDGTELHGVLTLPPGSDGRNLPTIINPHGGPFGLFDDFSYDSRTQMLAKAGYAVLQVNYRGSGNRGRAFTEAGAQQWGKAMQDDLTDATKWVVEQGIADGSRICIYGGSYGAYAALMGVAREPALYRCAVGYVGVYDLDKMVRDDTDDSTFMRNFSRQWVGTEGSLAAVSPNRLADRIRVPVFLAAGGEDTIAPIEHTKMMEQALRKAGVPVEALYFRNEAHGFYTEEHRREYYTRLLAFFAQHLGGAPAATAAGTGAGR